MPSTQYLNHFRMPISSLRRKYADLLTFFSSTFFHWLLIILGIILRLKHYLDNHSFWVDEAGTAVSIASRSYYEIIHQIELFPTFAKPPLGFLLIEKFTILTFGNNELVFRFYPLFCGMLSIFCFYFLLKKITDSTTVTLALFLFSISQPLVYYSAELKPYSSDVLFGLILFLGYLYYQKDPISFLRSLIYGLCGAIILWISNASLFVLAAIGFTMAGEGCLAKQKKKLCFILIPCILWLISFMILYKASLVHMVYNNDLKATWEGAFITAPVWTIEGLRWVKEALVAFINYPLNLHFPAFVFFLSILGFYDLWRKNKQFAILLVLPVFLTLLAAVLGKYPFRGRVLLFLVPYSYILVAGGVCLLTKVGRKLSFIIGVILLWNLFSFPVLSSYRYFRYGQSVEDNREVLRFFKEHYQKGDFIFLNTAAQFPFWYYAKSFKIVPLLKMEYLGKREGEVKIGNKVGQIFNRTLMEAGHEFTLFKYVYHVYDSNGNFQEYVATRELSQEHYLVENALYDLREHKRVWVYFARVQVPKVKELVLRNLERQGRQLLKYEKRHASVYLYGLTR